MSDRFDAYQLLEKVASGPVSDVYRAVQQPLGRRVLLRVLSPSILPSSPFAATLEREARLLSALDHPNVLRVLDFLRDAERLWVVFEDAPGEPLSALLARGRLPLANAVAIGVQLASALDHAHRRHVLHRDLHPRHIIVAESGAIRLLGFAVSLDDHEPPAPELLDLGADEKQSAYFSPEQILSEPADRRSDLFSLGVLLYELVTGRLPFGGTEERGRTQAIRNDPPTPIRRTDGVPPTLERVVLRCLEKLPTDRFDSARDVETALRSVLSDLGEPSLRGLLERRRNREPLGSVALEAPERREPLWVTLAALSALGVALLVSLAVVQQLEPASRVSAPAGSGLPLVPPHPAFLRVVAEPWAHVSVDGQQVETTPFADPVPLAAGAHNIRLDHPDAFPEERTVLFAEGQTVLLDIRMRLRTPKAPPSGWLDAVDSAAPNGSATGPVPSGSGSATSP